MDETASEAGGATGQPGNVSPEEAARAVKEAEESLEAAKAVQADAEGTPGDATDPAEGSSAEPTVQEFSEAATALRGLGQTTVAGFLDKAAERLSNDPVTPEDPAKPEGEQVTS